MNESVFILLTDTGTLFTSVIKRYTAAPFNHVSLSLDIRLNELYSFGRKHPRNPLYGGFVKEDVYTGTYRYFPNTRCTLLQLAVTERQRMRVKRIIDFFQNHAEAYHYNLLGLFGILINVPVPYKNAYFCSQFVTEVLDRSGIGLWDRPSALVTPNEFLLHSSFEKVYEGKLVDYPLLERGMLSEGHVAYETTFGMKEQVV